MCWEELVVKLEAFKMETDVFPRIGREELVPLFEALVKLLGGMLL